MLDTLFFQILNMSYIASFVILLVLIARLLLKKAPKSFSYALWSVVLFRLICPFSIQSNVSILPRNMLTIPESVSILQEAPSQLAATVSPVDSAVHHALSLFSSSPTASPSQPFWVYLGETVWLIGIGVFIFYSVASLLLLRFQLKSAVREQGNIYRTSKFSTPFVLGVFRPKIYLPSNLHDVDKRYILIHEQTHIARGDHIIKALAFCILCIHWFNPLVWFAFFLSGKDMEMSCDEAAIRKLGKEAKRGYSFSLLTMAAGHRILGGTPLAFSESNPKGRIKNILNYKKPSFWVFITLIILVIAFAISLLVNPIVSSSSDTRYPKEAFENFSANKDYSAISIRDASGNDITSTAIDLWWAANAVYDVDDVILFEMGDQTRLRDDMPDFYELINYNEIMPKIFTQHGIQQVEQTCIGSTKPFIQKQDGKVYRLGPWKTGYSYNMAMTDMQVKEAAQNRVTLTVKYELPLGYVPDPESNEQVEPEYGTVDFTIAKINGIWLVDDYVFVESYKE